MSDFLTETAVDEAGVAELSDGWLIGDALNGGYLVAPVLRRIAAEGPFPDPWSVTTHFLRPAGPGPARVEVEPVRAGRTTATSRGRLVRGGTAHVETLAVFGDLTAGRDDAPELVPPAPDLPPPEECPERTEIGQGVDLPIARRLEVRVTPGSAVGGASDRAVMEGWIRFRDGTPPSSLALTLFADAFPPSLHPLVGTVGWVPTIELTVHVRRRPAPGWILARFECDDLQRGRMVETGALWDSTGACVARSRQLGLLLAR